MSEAAQAVAQKHPKYILYYFDGPGAGEPTRLMFNEAGVPFEDCRFSRDEWNAKFKATMPFNACPVLEIDGVKHPESGAIERYIARRYGFYGDNSPQQQLDIDVIVESFNDVRMATYRWMLLPDGQPKEDAKAAFFKDTLPMWLNRVAAIHAKNNGGTGFLVGTKLTYADVMFLGLSRNFIVRMSLPNLLDSVPQMKALYDRLMARPAISAWYAKHPAAAPPAAATASAAAAPSPSAPAPAK